MPMLKVETVADLAQKETTARIADRAAQVQLDTLAAQFDAGAMLLRDIVAQLSRPGRDPRVPGAGVAVLSRRMKGIGTPTDCALKGSACPQDESTQEKQKSAL